jgi:hypothetical protein
VTIKKRKKLEILYRPIRPKSKSKQTKKEKNFFYGPINPKKDVLNCWFVMKKNMF